MSKNKRSGRRQNKLLGDVTLNDFANSAICKNRQKKSNTNVTQVVKQLDEKSWDEKLDEFEDFDFVQEENEDGTVSVILRKARRTKRGAEITENLQDKGGKYYPLDVWCLISEYIKPEDIGRFAGICKTSYAVVCTARFWFHLYKRFYQNEPNLPERLQPECMLRKYGVRTSVIRALYFIYPPLVRRLKRISSLGEHPDTLLRRQCVLMWHQRRKSCWIYCFKLKEYVDFAMPRSRNNESDNKPDLIEMLDDVSANPDENCRILQITCKQFIAIPPLLGLTLTSVAITLSQGFQHHRIQLGFGSGIQTSSPSSVGGNGNSVILLDPVIKVKILDWWHPLYPYGHNIELLLNHE